MPIRFRCAYCNQLLGISRRKAGTAVRCPTCAGQVVVPNVEAEETESGAGERDALIFERNDFDELLNSGEHAAVVLPKKEAVLSSSEAPFAIPSSANPPPGAWGTHAEPAYDMERLKPTPTLVAIPAPKAATSGFYLSPAKATALAIAVVILLAVAFAAGVLVGSNWKGSAVPSSHRDPLPPRIRAFPSVLARATIPDVLQDTVQRGDVECQPRDVG